MKYFVLLLFSCGIFTAHAGIKTSSTSLQCEYLINPIGIDVMHPRLLWKLPSEEKGIMQIAYQLMVDTDSVRLVKGMANMWNSGKINSASMMITYNGKPLQSFTKYFWKVIYWDNKGKRNVLPIANFETAMMQLSDWKGLWISDGKSMNERSAPYFRKQLNVSKEVLCARAYVAVGGLYELYVNGSKIGDRLLDPMFTRYDKRILYTTYDITQQMKTGANVFGVLLGNGWYNHQSVAVWNFHKAHWRNRPRFCMNVRVTYTDGTVDTFVSDETWKTSLGPVILNNIYTAEHYDARLEMPGWNTVRFNDASWNNAIAKTAPSQKNIVSQQLHPVKVVAKYKPAKLDKKSDTCYVYTFPRNMSGVTALRVKGSAGTVLRLKHGENLNDQGYVDMSNIDIHYRPNDDKDPFQTDVVILSGNEVNFIPKFNYKGFQYVEVRSSAPVQLTMDNLVACEVHSDVPVAGTISSSNDILNKIWKATNNSYLSNLFGYPTDCPQREKNGWTGDGHTAIETGLYNFDGITVYEKWMLDHKDEQRADGVLPAIIPTGGWGYDWANGLDWTSSVAVIPWQIYQFYGDSRILSIMYDNIRRYVDHVDSISPSGLTSWGLGDWVPVKTVSNIELTSSLYFYTDADILSKAATLFGKQQDAVKYRTLANKIKDAVNNKFLNKENGIYCRGSQTELSAALYFDIVPTELKKKVARNLYDSVVANNYHLDIGLLGSKYLLNALSDNGYADAAYRIATQMNYPSWGYWMINGATTLQENWPIGNESKTDAALISRNHIMFGEISAWFYKGLAGIKIDESQPGFKHILLKPNFVQELDRFQAIHNSPYGNIESKWSTVNDKIVYTAVIPANTTASLYIPNSKNGIDYTVKSGENITQLIEGEYTIIHLLPGTHKFTLNRK